MSDEKTKQRAFSTSRSSKLERNGLTFTKIYLVLLFGGLPVFAYLEIIELKPLSLNEFGDFMAGAFGPLALFWLVLGFFQQGDELRNSVEALRLQADELNNSVDQQKAMVGITQRQLDLDVAVREEQIRAAISKELPFFQLRASGSIPNTPTGRTYKYSVRNIGAPCAALTIFLEGGPIPNVGIGSEGIKSFAFIDNGETREFRITSFSNSAPNFQAMTLALSSENLREQKRKQLFSLIDGNPKQILVDPENV